MSRTLDEGALRSRMSAVTDGMFPDPDLLLAARTAGHRRRAQRRVAILVTAVVCLASLTLLASSLLSARNALPPISPAPPTPAITDTLAGAPVPTELRGTWLRQASVGGTELRQNLQLTADTYSLCTTGIGCFSGKVTVTNSQLAFYADASCFSLPGIGVVGYYSWRLSGTTLSLAGRSHDVCDRAQDLTDKSWARVS